MSDTMNENVTVNDIPVNVITTLDTPSIEVIRILITRELEKLPEEYGYYADDLARKLNLPTAIVVEITGQLLEDGLLAVAKP